jgi:hypothetical protein
VIEYHVHGVEILGGSSVPLENPGGEVTLQSGKPEALLGIMFENELDQPVAQGADSVVENDRVRIGGRHIAGFMLRHPSRCRTAVEVSSAAMARLAPHLWHVLFDSPLFEQVYSRTLLASDRAAEFGHEESGLERFAKGPARLLTPFFS